MFFLGSLDYTQKYKLEGANSPSWILARFENSHLRKTNLKKNHMQFIVVYAVTWCPPAKWFYLPSTSKLCVCKWLKSLLK